MSRRLLALAVALCLATLPAPAAFVPPGVPLGPWLSYSPSVSASSGTITTVGTTSGSYQIVGKSFDVVVSTVITTNGTGAGSLLIGLPPGVSAAANCNLTARRNDNGVLVQAVVFSAGTQIFVQTTAGAYPAADGAAFFVNGRCQAA